MPTSRLVVVVDANVLFPLTLRDTVLRAADAGCFQLRWSQLILDEVERNLVRRGSITAAQAARLRSTMEHAFPEALVTGHEPLISSMPPEDRPCLKTTPRSMRGPMCKKQPPTHTESLSLRASGAARRAHRLKEYPTFRDELRHPGLGRTASRKACSGTLPKFLSGGEQVFSERKLVRNSIAQAEPEDLEGGVQK